MPSTPVYTELLSTDFYRVYRRTADKMIKFTDAVVWVKNIFKINNVYECARPLLLVLGVFGVGATWISRTAGVYTLHNTSYTRLMTFLMSVICLPAGMIFNISNLFGQHRGFKLSQRVQLIIAHILLTVILFTIIVGYVMSYVSCKRLGRVFRIIHTVDSQLEDVNIRVKHWQITLKLTVIALITFNYYAQVNTARNMRLAGPSYRNALGLFQSIVTHLLFLWVILFVLIIHERFVCVNKVLQQNATVTHIHIVGERDRRDNDVLRRISLARHLHEQLTEAVQLFSDSCRYVVIGLLLVQMVTIILHFYYVLVHGIVSSAYSAITESSRVVVLVSICQANKNQRRVLSARLRHLCAYETNREIILQVQQYIMYNAHAVKGIIDLQFTDIDNVLLLTIINVVVSNVLIIYSYTRV